jgi:hypothetical protein
MATAELASTALAPLIAAQRTVFFITAIPFRSRRVLGARYLEIPSSCRDSCPQSWTLIRLADHLAELSRGRE